jgi:hypothetical protein
MDLDCQTLGLNNPFLYHPGHISEQRSSCLSFASFALCLSCHNVAPAFPDTTAADQSCSKHYYPSHSRAACLAAGFPTEKEKSKEHIVPVDTEH